jgi:hypothetical protein
MNAPKESYPLCWPPGKPMTPLRKTNGQFKTSFANARDNCTREVKLLGGSELIITTNIPLRRDGIPQAIDWGKVIPQPGVAVYFKRKGKQMCFACDAWAHVQDNMHAITLTISALRGIARWGTGDMMEAAFTGFTALPEKVGGVSWWEILGVPINATEEQINEAYRAKAKILHPDAGGNHDDFVKLNEAYRAATLQRTIV